MKKIGIIILVVIVAIIVLVFAVGYILTATGVIGTGMAMHQSAQETVETGTDTLNAAQIQIANAQIEQRVNDNGVASANDVRILSRTVKSLNDRGTFPQDVQIEYQSTTEDELDEKTLISSEKYNVSYEYGKEGYISKVIIRGAARHTQVQVTEENAVITVEE